ncbi:hypothetical protein AHAS_Ahas20G0146600 [Arachis hypogaea]
MQKAKVCYLHISGTISAYESLTLQDYASRSRCNSYSTKRQFKVKTVARIVESDAGKVICREAERIKPAAVVLGSRGRNLIQRFASPFPLQLSNTVLNF